MTRCEHLHFHANVEVARILPAGAGNAEIIFMAHVQVRCADCKTRFAFVGLPAGLLWTRPTTDPVGFELHAPIVPNAHATSMLGGDPETAFPVRGHNHA